MAHFANVNNDGIVTAVIVIPNEQEHRGDEFINNDLGIQGNWIQTSYNNRIRKQYAGVGMTYDADADVFIGVQPFPSWTLNENFDWTPPVPMPSTPCIWDEDSLSWVDVSEDLPAE